MIPIKYIVKYENQTMISGCEVVLNRYSDYDRGEMHTHNFIEVAYISNGHGWHVLGNQIYRCKPGDIYIINVGDPHFWMSELDTPLTINNLIFRPGFFDVTLLGKNNFAEMTGSFLLEAFSNERYYNSINVHFDSTQQPYIAGLYDKMLNEYKSHEPGFKELIRSWTIELLANIFRKYRNSTGYREVSNDALRASLAPVIDYLQQHYAENISLNTLASLAYLSPTYFSRVFKESTGCTVTEYLQKLRILNAYKMLQTTDVPVAVIAETCGYSDAKHFTRQFKRITGVSPSDARKKAHSHSEPSPNG